MKPRVLLVEDDTDILESMAELLALDGYEVLTARDGAEALERLRASHHLPEVIVLDLMMPTMSGWEFRDAQCRDPRLASIPIILLSGAPELPATAVELGARGWLKKPITIANLRAALDPFAVA